MKHPELARSIHRHTALAVMHPSFSGQDQPQVLNVPMATLTSGLTQKPHCSPSSEISNYPHLPKSRAPRVTTENAYSKFLAHQNSIQYYWGVQVPLLL